MSEKLANSEEDSDKRLRSQVKERLRLEMVEQMEVLLSKGLVDYLINCFGFPDRRRVIYDAVREFIEELQKK